LIAHRHGGDAATYTLPDDDAGREYLYILISHYANVDPNAPRRVIKLRAPWMSADEAERVIDMAFNYQRRWRSSTLGRELNYSEAEWRMLRLRTVGPTGMTSEERGRISDTARKERARRRMGAKTRAHYEGARRGLGPKIRPPPLTRPASAGFYFERKDHAITRPV